MATCSPLLCLAVPLLLSSVCFFLVPTPGREISLDSIEQQGRPSPVYYTPAVYNDGHIVGPYTTILQSDTLTCNNGHYIRLTLTVTKGLKTASSHITVYSIKPH